MAGMERVLFYLPVVTPWWFDNIVAHMIRTLSACAEVHVIVPPLWRNTGIGPEQLRCLDSSPAVQWHIAEGDHHPSLRTSPADPDGVVEFVRSIDPAYTFCRSADIITPSRFPGKVRHLLEAGAPPLSMPTGWIILQPDFWHHGAMPDLTGEDRAAIEGAFADIWARMRTRAACEEAFALPRSEMLGRLGLPQDRKIIALPLEYEHEEVFTAGHNRFERNLDLIRYLADNLHEDFVIAISDHPLNRKYVDNSRLYEAIAALGSRVHLVPSSMDGHVPTDLLVKHCDGLVVQNTKVIYSGAFFGKPTLRLSHRPSAAWLGVHEDVGSFEAAILGGEGPVEDRTRLWFGCHVLHDIIDPATVSAAEILDRVDRPFSRDRLAEGLDRIDAHHRQMDLAA
jgi:hypothetical protein